MQNILDKIKDILSRKGMIKALVTILALAGICVYGSMSTTKDTGHKIENNQVAVSSEKEESVSDLTDPSEIEIEPTGRDNPPVMTEPVPETDKAETVEVEEDDYYINACTQALAMWIEQDGRFTNLLQNEDEWYIIDCNVLVESEPKFANLYEMRTTVNNVDTIYNDEGEVRYREYSTIYLDCFATDNGDGTATIHYLGSSIGVLINDGFVTDEMKDITIRM